MGAGVSVFWRAVHACIRGRGHERDGSGCDDRALVKRTGGLTVAALADGCSSARLGGLAARVAVERAVASIDDEHTNRDRDLVELTVALVRAAAYAVVELAEDLEVARSDVSTTLMVAVARGQELAVVHVGDGVVVGRRDGTWSVLSSPLGGEHANETFVLADPAFLEHARVSRFADVTACALLTDGAAASLWERSSNRVAAALDKVARALEDRVETEVEAALRTGLCPELRRRTTDDCGLSLLARTG
jgi:hypothetical protein